MTAAGENLGSLREAFHVPPEVAYFNTASLAPQLRRVREAGIEALSRRGEPWTISARDWFTGVERIREGFGSLVGSDGEGVAIIPASSYGFAVVARNLRLRESDRILVLAEEYPSGIYSWRAAARASGAKIVTVEREKGQAWTDAILETLDEAIAVVSVPNVHWTDGALVDLVAVSERAREVGAKLVIDGSQSIGAMPFDVGEVRPDYLISVGYKWLLGPFGVSFLYVAEEHRDGLPIEENWITRAGSEDFARLVDYPDEYQPGARRFDVGQRSHFEITPMAAAALDRIHEWGVESIALTLGAVTGRIADGLGRLGLEPDPPDRRGPHMLGVRLPGDAQARVVPALAEAGCFAAMRGDSLRISPHLHVSDEDVDRLIEALSRAVGGAGLDR